MKCKNIKLFLFLICVSLAFSSCVVYEENISYLTYDVINNNTPEFEDYEITTESFEFYSELDYLGRCGVAFACIGKDIMPTEERGSIGQVKPTGWQMEKYDIVDGKYLYNRCHLIGFQLSGENANERNLITGTRYMNTEGMLPFENMVADYVRETGNHVMYRVTPVFEGINLLAKGVQMEAYSVEDKGKGVSFNVFVNNIQPGIEIDYSNGKSRLSSDNAIITSKEENENYSDKDKSEYVINTNTKKFHLPSCSSIEDIKEKNKESYNGSKKWLTENGYSPCGICRP